MKTKSKSLILLLFFCIIILIVIIYLFNNKDKYKYKDELSQLRICGTGNKNSLKINKLGAVVLTPKKWNQNSRITVKFLDIPDYDNGFKNTYEKGKFKDYDENKNEIFYDPYELPMHKRTDISECIKKIVRNRIEPITNLQFIFLPNDYSAKDVDIRISFNPKEGCSSHVGTDCYTVKDQTESTMNFGWFDVGTVLHEFGHVLGLEHEHQSTFDNTINWNYKKLYKWADEVLHWTEKDVKEQILDPLEESEGTSYDPESIMLYYYPAYLTKDGKGTKQNIRLSPIDVLYINKLYPINYINEPWKDTPQQFYERVYGENIDHIVI